MRNLVTFIFILAVSTLTGCATVPMASLDQDAMAKDFTPPEGKASLYIYRNEALGAAVPITMSVNDRTIGQTASKTYFRFNVKPGKYVVKAHAENVAQLSVVANAGSNYFVWQEMKMGMWSARANLVQVDESVGRVGVTESKLIASPVTDQQLEATALAAGASGPDLSASQKLRELQKLKDEGVINDGEFEVKKAELLEKL